MALIIPFSLSQFKVQYKVTMTDKKGRYRVEELTSEQMKTTFQMDIANAKSTRRSLGALPRPLHHGFTPYNIARLTPLHELTPCHGLTANPITRVNTITRETL